MKGGEAAITVDMIQKVAEILRVDPVTLMTVQPEILIEGGNNSPGAVLGKIQGSYNYQTFDKNQSELLLKLMENVLTISEKLIVLLDKDQKG